MATVYRDRVSGGSRKRLVCMGLGVICFFAGFVIRLAQIQLVNGNDLSDAARRNFSRQLHLPAKRGAILDRNGKKLAVHQPAFDLYVTPAKVGNLDETLATLMGVIDLNDLRWMEIREKILAASQWRDHQPQRIARDIDRLSIARIEALRSEHPSLSLRMRYQRQYPDGRVGSHLLGYLGKLTRKELDAAVPGTFRVDSMIGRFGLEKKYQDVLAGHDGHETYVVDAHGARQATPWAARALEQQAQTTPPQPGLDLVLTIDSEVQDILVSALAKYQSGAAIVLNPRDGSIRGMISKPDFDPNQWSGRLTAEAKRLIDNNPYHPMLDKAVHAYFPGSVYKVVTALAALEEGAVAADSRVDSPGAYDFGQRLFRCHKRSGHGRIDLATALAASADVYFYKLGETLGIDTLADYGQRFGFGKRSGIAINSESPGMTPTRAHHEEKSRSGFQPGFALSTAVGQGDVKATPLQVALAYAAIANGGRVMVPRLVDRIQDASGRVVREMKPQVAALATENLDALLAIRKGLEKGVLDSKLGTGYRANARWFDVAGKTGTAQVRRIERGQLRQTVMPFRYRDHAWFAGYAPAHNPDVVVVVFLEHGGSGGADAAPVARQILEAYHQRVQPLFSATAQLRLEEGARGQVQ